MLGAATTPTIPQKVLKAVEVSSREMVFAPEKYKASISAPAISVTVLARVKTFTLLGLANQSEGADEAFTKFPLLTTGTLQFLAPCPLSAQSVWTPNACGGSSFNQTPTRVLQTSSVMRDVNAWLKQPNLPSYVVGMNGIVMRDFQSLAVKDVIRVLLLRLHSCNYKHTKENERGKLSHVMQHAVLEHRTDGPSPSRVRSTWREARTAIRVPD